MLFIPPVVLLAILGAMCHVRYNLLKKRGEHNEYDAVREFLYLCSMATILIGFLVSSWQWYYQLSDIEDVAKFVKIEAIYKSKAEILTAEFSKHLAETYPEHEKDIYDKISPEQVELYFAKYPELRASETLTTLVDKINKLQNDVYEQQINVVQAQKNIRLRLRNPWLLRFMIPTE